MGLFHNLLDTYSKCEDIVGVVRYDDNGEANEKKTFLPIYHITFKSEFCVILNENGELLDITRDKGQTIIIPSTEDSASRANNIAAHPLCDKLDYVSGEDQKKFDNYLFTLGNWKELASDASKRKLEAVYNYIKNKTILEDIISRDLFKDTEYKDKSKKIIDFKKIKDIGVRFQVQIPGDMCMNVWEDKNLRQSWIDCYNLHYDKFDSNKSSVKGQIFDYINGKKVYKITSKHPKKIITSAANAKLISCNDYSGFTFRGRFENQDEAVIIDYEQSQKIHQALIWLINNYGFNLDTQSLIIWAIDNNPQPLAIPLYDSMTIFNNLPSQETEVDLIERVEADIYANYSKEIKKVLLGYGKVEKIRQQERKICIAIFDVATTGRMGLTFYQELFEGDYLKNIVKWHEETSYYFNAWIKEKDSNGKEKNKLITYIGAPSFDDILFAIYGKPHSASDKTYQMLKKRIRKQMLECMFGNFSFPKNIVDSAARRASQPLSFTDNNNSFDFSDWQKAINISCALIRKYYNQKINNQEEYKMELEESRRDRDYLYGRLLAIADKLEQTALYHANKADQRATNAVRLMNAFSLKPYHTWGIIYHHLLPYRMQLNGATFFQQKIDEVMALFKEGDFENNRPLSPLYLLGYSAQMRALTKKQDKEENKNVE